MLPKRRNQGKDNSPTPLDHKQAELAAQEAEVRAEMAKHQRLIEKAPEIAKEQAKRRREELINRASRTDARPGSRAALPDHRHSHELNVAVPARHKSLRAERNQGRLLFFALLFILGGMIYLAYRTFLPQ
jgi:hypothetical protein